MEKAHADQALREEIAEAIQGASVKHAEELVEQSTLPTARICNAFLVAQSEADRSASILLFALIEDLMLDCFQKNFNPKVHGGWKQIVSGNGLLSTASNRLSLLELLYWIKPSTASDLRLLKSIRNRFAHHADVHAFSDPIILGWISSMSPREQAILSKVDYFEGGKPTLRFLYLIRAAGVIFSLAREIIIAPAAREAGVHPSLIHNKEFDKLPNSHQEFYRAQADIFIDIGRNEGSSNNHK